MDKMTPDELREFIKANRAARTSPPTFVKKLKEEVEDEPEMADRPSVVKAKASKAKAESEQKLLEEYL